MKNFFYIARFYPEQINFFDKLGFSRNFSVNKKIKGVLAALKFKNNICGCICTTVETPRLESVSKSFKIDNLKIYSPHYYKSSIRFLSYFLNILSTTNQINKVYLKNKNSNFICWDFLPDTLLPLLISKVPLKKIIMDIEEFIQKDPEANFFFKLFEKFFTKVIIFKKYFLASKNLIINHDSLNIEINGFFAQSKKEENLILKKLNSISKKNKKINIFYTGRLDNNRGSDLLANLSKNLEKDKNIFLTVFTFGDYKLFCSLKKNIKNKNVRLFFEEKRTFYLKNIIRSDIALNLLKDQNFAKNSFPSKLIEYMLFSKTIISTVKINNINYKNLFITKYDADFIYKKIKKISKNMSKYNLQYKNRSRMVKNNYSIINLQKKFKKKFNEI